MRVELRYFDDCPHWRHAEQLLRELADEFEFDLGYRRVDTPEDAERLKFPGSPSIVVDGKDPFAQDDEPVGLSCRIFRTPDGLRGVPTAKQLRSVIATAGAPTPQRDERNE